MQVDLSVIPEGWFLFGLKHIHTDSSHFVRQRDPLYWEAQLYHVDADHNPGVSNADFSMSHGEFDNPQAALDDAVARIDR